VGPAPYERCVRLIAFAAVYWEVIDGQLASSSGQDLLDLRFDRFLNAVYWFLISQNRGGGMESTSLDEVKKIIDAEISKPLPTKRGRQRVSEAVIEDEMALFRQAAAAPPPTGR
jgi:hypothetical protein